MNQEAFAEFKKPDRDLNKVYPQVLAKLDERRSGELKAAQAGLVPFRCAGGARKPTARAGGGGGRVGGRWLALRSVPLHGPPPPRHPDGKQLRAFFKGIETNR